MTFAPKPYFCPVSQLPIIQHPDWQRIRFSNDYAISIEIIGERILLTHSYGLPTLSDSEKTIRFIDKIIDEQIANPYIHIFDYNALCKNISIEVRRYVITKLKERRRMLAAIYYGLSPALSFSIKVGRFFNLLPFVCLIGKNYREAVNSALVVLKGQVGFAEISHQSSSLDWETAVLLEKLPGKLEQSDNGSKPLDSALEILADETKHWDRQAAKERQIKSMQSLEKILAERNKRALMYQRSIHPVKKTSNIHPSHLKDPQ